MKPNKQALREAAEKATPGPWEMEQENIWFTDEDGYTKHLAYVEQGDDVDDQQDHDNTAYIAAFNPKVALALLEELDRLESFRTAFTEWHDKTEWVQDDKRFNVLKPWGKHRADVLREYIEHLERRIAELEAREVELPGRIADIDLRSPLEVEDMYRYKTKSMLRAAGIRVKN